MLKLKKGDTVQIIKGKDRGKKGKILKVLSAEKKLIVEGLNLVKKHMRRTQQEQQHTGIVTIESPFSSANAMFYCKNCNRPVRLGFKVLNDKTKTRFCKKCKETI